MVDGIEKAQKSGEIPYSEDIVISLMAGLTKGYPDIANYDFADWLKVGRKEKLQDSNIPFTGLYREAEPNYDFNPSHSTDQSIVENIASATKILKEFYEGNFHKKNEDILSPYLRKQ